MNVSMHPSTWSLIHYLALRRACADVQQPGLSSVRATLTFARINGSVLDTSITITRLPDQADDSV